MNERKRHIPTIPTSAEEAVRTERRRIWGAIYGAHVRGHATFTKLQIDWLESVIHQHRHEAT